VLDGVVRDGGRIRAESELKHGSRFIVEISKGEAHFSGEVLDRRQDDQPGVITERLKVYGKETEPLRVYYKKKKAYHAVEGSGTKEDVFARLTSALNGILAAAVESKGQSRR
jgi:adenylate kinase